MNILYIIMFMGVLMGHEGFFLQKKTCAKRKNIFLVKLSFLKKRFLVALTALSKYLSLKFIVAGVYSQN